MKYNKIQQVVFPLLADIDLDQFMLNFVSSANADYQRSLHLNVITKTCTGRKVKSELAEGNEQIKARHKLTMKPNLYSEIN